MIRTAHGDGEEEPRNLTPEQYQLRCGAREALIIITSIDVKEKDCEEMIAVFSQSFYIWNEGSF